MKRFAAGLLSVSLIATALAASTELRVELDSDTVGVKDPVVVRIVIDGPDAGQAQLEGPVPKGRRLIPSGGQSTSFQQSWVNGTLSVTKTIELRFLPTDVGAAEVPALTVNVAGERRQTPTIPVKIVEQAARPGTSSRPDDNRGPLPIEIETRVSRRDLFVGEPLLLEYVLRSRVSVQNAEPDQALDFPSFLREDVKLDVAATHRQIRDERGQPWNEWVLIRKRLTPTKSGRLEIPAIPFGITFERRTRDFFGLSFPSQLDRAGVVAARVEIVAKPLPTEGRPSDFSGAVGKLTFEAMLKPDTVRAGEATNLELTISGSGNIQSLSPPPVAIPPDADGFDLTEKDSSASRRRWVMPIVPRREGRLEIGPLQFSAFDPEAKQYRTTRVGPLVLNVLPGERDTSNPVVSIPGPSSSASALGSFPAFSPTRGVSLPWSRFEIWWLALALPWIVALTSTAWSRLARWRGATQLGRSARERRRINQQLQAAQQAAGSDPAEASRRLLLALHLWADRVVGEPTVPMPRSVLEQRLGAKLARPELTSAALSLFDRASALRYAGQQDASTAASLCADIARLVESSR